VTIFNKNQRRALTSLIILAAGTGLTAWPVHGSETNDYIGASWALEDMRPVLKAAAEITPAKYPDSDTATVEQKSVREYRADGTAEAQDETFVKTLTEKGRRDNRTLGLAFTLPYTTVDVVKLEVVHPDGTVSPVDVAANSEVNIDDSQTAMNIYDPNNKVLQVNLPKVEIGDMIHSVIRQTTERPIIPGDYAEENVFEGSGYLRHLDYEVHAPATRPLQRVRLRAEIPSTVSYTGETNAEGAVTHRWEVTNVPRMFDEPGMPPYDNVLQRLLVSTLPDWPTVSKWYWNLSQPHLDATTPELQKTNEVLTAGMTNDMDKIKAIFYYVSKNIRYMGLTPEKDRPGFEPHDVKLTFAKNYGVCRDKAALLVAMLREAGLKSYPVLISVNDKRDPEVPDPDFNHAIVCVEQSPGQYLLMDPTDENTRELLPAYDRNQSYLVCRPEGEQLLVSPVQPPEQNLMRIQTTGTLSANGELEAKSELAFEGVNDDEYRNAFVKMKPDDLRRFFELRLKQSVPGAKLESLTLFPANMLDMSAGLHAELEFSAAGLTAAGNGKAMVAMPWIGNNLGIINFILRDATGLEKRKYPLQTGVTCGLVESVDLKLDAGFAGAVSLPTCTPVADECLGRHETFANTNQTLAGTRDFMLKTVEFSPEQYLQLKQTLKAMQYDGRKMPVLALAENRPDQSPAAATGATNTPVNSDALILDSSKTLTVTGTHTAVYRVKYSKRILSYNGKKREAELKIEYNPACQDAKLIHAVSVSPSGQREEISPGEINVMDAGWNGSAQRYTGGKILVANLPDVLIGSVIEVQFEITTKPGKPFLAGFEAFQLPDALEHKSFVLTAPSDVKVQRLVSGPHGIIQDEHSVVRGEQTFHWQADSVQAVPAEMQLPPEWTYAAGVSYFIGDADTYYQELNQTLLDRSRQSTNAAILARQLTATATNRLAAVRAIRDFIAQSIRLAGPAFTDLPLAELSAADTTLADGYGHQADRAILFHALLTAAGFQPEFVLASELPPVKGITGVVKTFPLPQNFQTPLIRVVVDGETYYLNDTDQYAQLGATPHDGRLGFVLASRTGCEIHATKNGGNRTETQFTLSVADDGRTRIGVRRDYYGDDFGEKNRYFSELPPEERRRYFQELVSQTAQGARPVGDLTTDFDHYPGREEFAVDVDNFAVVDGKYLYFNLPFTPSLFTAGTDQRALPYFIAEGGQEIIRTEIALPVGFPQIVIAPKNETLHAPGGTARIRSTNGNGRCVITDELETTPAIVPAADYPEMLKLEATLHRKSANVFLLEKN
jgi:transglutaminase-like putative cysteine protease